MRRKQAIAFEYGRRDAPIVVAKGSDEIAEKILEEARRHGIFVAEDPQLLAALSRLELDEQIPEECYAAVAVVLAWAFRLRGISPDRR
ncbi:MAG: flagellar biosynthesis protein FlhB [Betaproteobacteria bacterium]|nr:flagellar biosynthesis protein FlhB [Betaproteobacteria bacterium]